MSKNKLWGAGSVFLIPLKDGSECIGVVISRERSVLNSVAIALFDQKGAWSSCKRIPHLLVEDIFSVVLSTKDLLDSGRWAILGVEDVEVSSEMKSYESLRSSGFVGAKVRGSGIVEEFVNAFYGLAPWDDWYIPNYLDGLLISPDKKPVGRLYFSGRHS